MSTTDRQIRRRVDRGTGVFELRICAARRGVLDPNEKVDSGRRRPGEMAATGFSRPRERGWAHDPKAIVLSSMVL
jgi:hypothetical protein